MLFDVLRFVCELFYGLQIVKPVTLIVFTGQRKFHDAYHSHYLCKLRCLHGFHGFLTC